MRTIRSPEYHQLALIIPPSSGAAVDKLGEVLEAVATTGNRYRRWLGAVEEER
jgi:hypothetical protein